MAEPLDRRRSAIFGVLIGLILVGYHLASAYVVFDGVIAPNSSHDSRAQAAVLLLAAVVGLALTAPLLLANLPLLRATPGPAADIARHVAVVTRWLAVGWLIAFPVLALVVAGTNDRPGRFGGAIFEALIVEAGTIMVLVIASRTIRAAGGRLSP